MASLKLFIPIMANILRLNPHALYERQRVLMREGLLSTVEGRGPGSGVRLSPTSVAILLISFLATDALADTGPETRALAQARRVENDFEDLRGAKSFRTAMINILSFDDVAAEVSNIKVERRFRQVTVFLKEPNPWVDFGASQFDIGEHEGYWATAWLSGKSLKEIGSMLRKTEEANK